MSDYPGEEFLAACYLNHIDKFTEVTDEDRKVARRAFNAIKAAAWDEGYMTGCADGFNRSQGRPATNPYRQEDER